MHFLRTVSFRVFAGSLLLLLVAFGLYSYFAVRFYTNLMMAQTVEAAHRVSDLIESSTRYSMLLNRREDVFQIIRTIGTEPGVEGIRIYNKRGVIQFSTDPAEMGAMANLREEACYACHEREKPLAALPMNNRVRVFQSRGHRVLGVINPIHNAPMCANATCHAHPPEHPLLGVLDVRMSLAHADDAIRRSETMTLRVALGAFLAVAVASAAFLYVTLRRPIAALTEGTRQLAAGNLDHRIGVHSPDDLGQLAASFDAMTTALREAREENRRWAQTLEDRVREKTEELKRIDAQILQIEKMASLGTLAASVAHEINNPLSGILTYAKLQAKRIRREGADSELLQQVLKDLDLIVEETQRCGVIVRNLLLFSRKQEGEFSIVPLREVLERAVSLVAHHLSISNVRLETQVEPEDVSLYADPNQLQQALVAMFVNAVEAMPDGGTLQVEVTCAEPGEEVRIRVRDTGVGIAPEALPHIFEPFFTTKAEGKGVGLGLSVVYGIVERHGGTITVQSELGKGANFTLTFPPVGRGAGRPGEAAAPVGAPGPGEPPGTPAAPGRE